MRRIILSILSFFLFICLSSAQSRPKLVVGIVVDQMRWDYLYRYYSHYGNDGFKRLMRDGFNCQQAVINYLPAFTAPGHSCIYTGSVPAINGIVGNDWMESGKLVYCTDDKNVEPVGGSKKWGQMSPKNLLTTTITDELRLATNLRSRVFAISLKDRSSILPGGHLSNGTYWFDDSTGNFMTSSYYAKDLPHWLKDFNARHYPDSMLAKDWMLRDDVRTYTQSLPDDSKKYEGKFSKDEPDVTFPHLAGYFTGTGITKYNAIRKIPAGNALTLKLARACIRSNELGSRSDADFLAVSLSATDYAGHQFGPNALEMEDMYIRLDDEIGRFLHYLDNTVGEGEYTVFLTADHGAAHNTEFLKDLKIPAGNVSEGALRSDLNTFLKKETGKDSMVRTLENYQVNFADEKIAGLSFDDRLKLKLTTIGWLRKRPEIAFAIDLDLNILSEVPEPIHTMAVNGYYKPRCGSIQIILKPGYYAGYAPTGTTHGTWNPYDTHIPLLFFGYGINKGKLYREVHMTDITATICALMHIQVPNGCIGKVIPEVLD